MLFQRILAFTAAFAITFVEAVYPHWTSGSSLCTEGNWYLGYNSDANIAYQAMDVHPTLDYFLVAGSSSAAAAAGLTYAVYGDLE